MSEYFGNITIKSDFSMEESIIFRDKKGQQIFIRGENKMVKWDAVKLTRSNLNPSTYNFFTQEEKDFIVFNEKRINNSSNFDTNNLSDHFEQYDQLRRSGKSITQLSSFPDTKSVYEICRYYMTPYDMYSHFRHYEPNDNFVKYERVAAEQYLSNHYSFGRWLLRNSSFNRTQNQDPGTYKKYFALTFCRSRKISHTLIVHDVGAGWYVNHSGSIIYFVCFLDALEFTLSNLGLFYNQKVGEYITAF